MVQRIAIVALLGGLAVAVSGCATSAPLTQVERRQPLTAGARILLMEPDVQLYEVTAAGLLEAKADWTANARSNVGAALAAAFADKQVAIVEYKAPSDVVSEHAHGQLIKLHERVGGTIVTFRYGQVLRLPGKGDTFD